MVYFVLTASDIAVKIKILIFLKIVTMELLHDIIMPNLMLSRNVLMGFLPIVFMVAAGCEGLKKPGEFVESLRNPYIFSEIYLPEIKNIDDIVNEKGLVEGENVKAYSNRQRQEFSIYLFQIRQNAEMDAIIISYMMR